MAIIEAKEKRWNRKKLSKMLFHNFIGTIADNIVEIGWVLCFSLLANKLFVERVTTMFGLNEALWVILSSTYYTTRTAMTALLPKSIIISGKESISKYVKNYVYMFYIMLLPLALLTLFYMDKLLMLLGVKAEDLAFYSSYFNFSVIAILITAPWSIMVPAYLRTQGETYIASKLEHIVAWTTLFGIFFTTHILHLGVLTALIVNMFANIVPLIWFIIKNPIPNFWNKGVEFSWKEIRTYWVVVKWELVRRLSPRVATIIGFSFIMLINPIFLAIKYWVSSLSTLLEGWIDSMAGLLNSHVSRNYGLKLINKDCELPYNDNNFVFKIALIGAIVSTFIIYIIAYFFLQFLPENIYKGVINPYIYILLIIEITARLRYYMWLSISRSYKQELNGVAQLIYAIPTALLTPLLMWIFLFKFSFGLLGIFAVSTIVALVQWILAEIYFNKKLKE